MPRDGVPRRRLLPRVLNLDEAPLFLSVAWVAVARAVVLSEIPLIEIDGEKYVRTRDLLAALECPDSTDE